MIRISKPLALEVFGEVIFVCCKFQITRTGQHFLVPFIKKNVAAQKKTLKALYIEKINADDMHSHYSGLSWSGD